jgi:hypothetical protein
MYRDLVEQRLDIYQCTNALAEENALKEIAQEIALLALSRSDFFRAGAFHGGTCLRILYGLPRFSEDLDFMLDMPNKDFSWEQFLTSMIEEFESFGFQLEVQDRTKLDTTVQKAFIKVNSLGAIIQLKHIHPRISKKLRIKFEIDTNPPEGQLIELKYLNFPLPFSIKTHDLNTSFSGKCHALLCREYVKGRDWFDFDWYVSRNTAVNYPYLSSAINQQGPWQQQNIKINNVWLIEQLKNKINNLDWTMAKTDVARFLRPQDLSSIALWSTDYFLSRLERFDNYLT